MFGAIIVLVVLILVTPSLMGRPTVLTPPVLIVGVTPDKANLTVYVTASVQAYLYDDITVNLTYWHVHVWLRDEQDNYFEDNVTVRVFQDPANQNALTLAFTFPDDKSAATVTRSWTDDFRVAIPRRGTLP